MTAPQPTDYVLGTHAAELARLGLQHRLWSDAAHTLWRRAGIRPGQSVLDVGCGPGFAAFDLAQLVGPAGRVVGVDQSETYLDHARAQASARGLPHLRVLAADVTALTASDALRREADDRNGFDLAYERWCLCFVDNPEAVVRGVAALLRPGGRWALQDYFNYESMCTAPRSPAFERAVRATANSWRTRGGDPDVMGRVPALLAAHGFAIEHLGVHQRLARPGDSMWAWPETFWTTFLPTLVQLGLLTESDRTAWHDEWTRLSTTPTAYCVLPAVYDIVAVKQ